MRDPMDARANPRPAAPCADDGRHDGGGTVLLRGHREGMDAQGSEGSGRGGLPRTRPVRGAGWLLVSAAVLLLGACTGDAQAFGGAAPEVSATPDISATATVQAAIWEVAATAWAAYTPEPAGEFIPFTFEACREIPFFGEATCAMLFEAYPALYVEVH